MEIAYKPNLKKRAFATLVDYTLYLGFAIAYLTLFGTTTAEGMLQVHGMAALPPIAVWFLYFVVAESYYGATLGHYAFHLEVLTLDGKKIGTRQALKRHLLDILDFGLYGICAFITIKNTEKHQRLGDLWAKTAVVDKTDKTQAVR